MANLDYDRQEEFVATGNAADYAGIAAYAKYAFNPNVAVAGRYEYFNDHDGLGHRHAASQPPERVHRNRRTQVRRSSDLAP